MLLFVITLLVLNPVALGLAFGRSVNALAEGGRARILVPEVRTAMGVEMALQMFLLIWTVVVGACLLRRCRSAVRYARIFLLGLLGFALVRAAFPLILSFPESLRMHALSAYLRAGVQPVVYAVFWLCYLGLSSRVALTFGGQQEVSSSSQLFRLGLSVAPEEGGRRWSELRDDLEKVWGRTPAVVLRAWRPRGAEASSPDGDPGLFISARDLDGDLLRQVVALLCRLSREYRETFRLFAVDEQAGQMEEMFSVGPDSNSRTVYKEALAYL